MGEDRTAGDESPSSRRLTVPEAAAELGITEGAVRGRLKRGTLGSAHEGRTVYVLLEGASPSANRDETSDPQSDQSELIAVLREQLAAERQAHAEARRLLMAALERIPPQLEAPSEAEDSESPETVEEASDSAEPRSATGGAQKDARRPWWRRVFGG